MSTAVAEQGPGPARRGGAGAAPAAPPVSSGAAALLLVGAVVAAALVSISVARLVPDDADAVLESRRPVPAEPAGAAALRGVDPVVTFEGADGPLPAGALGAWSVEAGDWAVAGGAARATEVGEEGALAVATAPAGSSIAQVTLTDPEPGAGLVVSYRDAEHYIALQVGRSGSDVQLVEVDGRPLQPRVLVSADLPRAGTPLVLAVHRHLGGYEAVANGLRLGHRTVEEDGPDPWRVGLVTGARPTATATAFDDLVVA